MTERPSARRSPFAPPAAISKAIIQRNPKAKPIPAAAVEPPRMQSVPTPSSRAEGVELTQQDAVDLVFALTDAVETANANVQRWAHKGDPHRMDAALVQAKRFETLRERIAASIPKLTRKG